MLYFTTSGISQTELLILKPRLPSFLAYEPYLTTRTSLLITYKATFTDKHIQALKWKLPVIHIEWLYDTNKNQKNYILDVFEGATFCTSKISNDVFKMYCKFLGAEWLLDMDRSVTFLIANETIKNNKETQIIDIEAKKENLCTNILQNNNIDVKKKASINENRIDDKTKVYAETINNVRHTEVPKTKQENNSEIMNANTQDDYSEKVLFAHKYKIPIIQPENVFLNKWEILRNEKSYEAIKKQGALFHNTTFFIDPNLPPTLFNALKRIIIENSGVRVSKIEDNIDFIITSLKNYDNLVKINENNIIDTLVNTKYKTKSTTPLQSIPALHYQYIFDCKDTNSLLMYNFYEIQKSNTKKIFENIYCYIDKSLTENKNEIINKIEAMGGKIRNTIQNITHLIVKNRNEYKTKPNIPFKIVLYDWINQCLFYGKVVNEEKYIVRPSEINEFEKYNILNRKSKNMPTLNLIKTKQEKLVIRNTTLTNVYKEKTIDYEQGANNIKQPISESKQIVNDITKHKNITEKRRVNDFNNFSNHSLGFFTNEVKYLQNEIIFQFTGLATFLKNKIINTLKASKVKYIDSPKFEGCTHLIMGTANTSEKFMCAISRGCYILIPDFINVYDGSINFNFEKYEWNDENTKDKGEKRILGAIKNWRMRIKESQRYAFYGWNVTFFCSEAKQRSLEYLIECGGGSVVSLDDDANDQNTESGNKSIENMEDKEKMLQNADFLNKNKITHVFVTKKYIEKFETCKNYNTKILGINYIYEYLFK
ncbi:DNA topoisomerase 2-binding protein 1 [Binucleata daphniae]